MARTRRKGKVEAEGETLYTLSAVSKRTKISMPTLQRYKKLYQDRIPSVGAGRKQRYPAAALPVFEQLKEENIGRRGRPRKSGAAGAAKARRTPPPKKSGAAGRKGGRKAAVPSSESTGLLTLTEMSKRTGISYPTLVRYVKLHGAQIPFEGKGRRRRYHPDAVEIFKRLRAESPRGGGRKKAAAATGAARGRRAGKGRGTGTGSGIPSSVEGRLKGLEKSLASLEKALGSLVAKLEKPRKLI